MAAEAQETAAIEIKDFTLGAADAPVKLTEYASFTCPHCATFHKDIFGKLKADYIDTGKVLFEYREVYFDRYGLWAAMMARCGGEMRYFGITDILFDTQQEWAASEDPTVVVENLKKIGRTAGMDNAALDICMKDPAMAEALVAHFETNFKADGIEGTPSILINGVKHPNMAYDELKAVLDAELAK
jgi:protein-disulfide isomerase